MVFRNATIRQTVKVTLAASTVRLQISNAFGGSDLPITAATIALPANGSAGTSAIDSTTLRPLTFSGGNPGFTIPNGALALTDPLTDFPVKAGTIVTVSLYLQEGQTTNAITSHPGSRTTSYFTPGNAVEAADVAADPATLTAEHWYFLSGIEAYLPARTSALAIVGDSITDGRGSTTNNNDRWPDVLSAQMQRDPATRDIAVLNQAAGGNRVLQDGLGPNALGRVGRDVLAQPGVRYVMVFEGVNDIGTAATDAATQKALGDRLLAAYEQMITRLHGFGLPVFGATITPFSGPDQVYGDPERERTRQRVNAWIRDSGRFDAVVDFDALVRNETSPDRLSSDYDVGDHLHLNPAGYRAMGRAVDLTLFSKFANGVDRIV